MIPNKVILVDDHVVKTLENKIGGSEKGCGGDISGHASGGHRHDQDQGVVGLEGECRPAYKSWASSCEVMSIAEISHNVKNWYSNDQKQIDKS